MNLENIRQHTIKTILQFSVPSIIAMVLTSLITVADGFFIGNYIGKDGIAAVNLGLPVIYLFLAIGLMVSVGFKNPFSSSFLFPKLFSERITS